MKKIISILLAVILCLTVCVGSVISANETEPEYSYYGRILGLGDSWLCGVGANPAVKVPVKAAETLGWEYGSLGGANGGWYTANVVNVINPEKEKNVYDEMVDADTIVIHVGTNDFCGTSHYTSGVKNGETFKELYDALEASYMKKINGIISSIKTANPDALVLLGTMWCSHTNGYTDRLAELETEGLTDDEINAIYEDTRNYYRVLAQKSANAKLAAVADSEENVVLFDVDTLMGYGEEKGNSTYVSSNRHPKASGYELMANEVVKLIREYYGEENPTFAHPVTTPSEVTTATTTTTTTKEGIAEDYYTIEDVSLADNWQVGQYDMNNGSYNPSNANRACLKKLVKVDSTKTYVLNATNASGKRFVLREYDSNMTFIKSYGTVNLGKTYTPSSASVAYVGITLYEGAPLESIQAGTIVPSMTVYDSTPSESTTTTTTTKVTTSTTTTTTQKAEESSSATQPSNPTISSLKLFDADTYSDTIKTDKGANEGDIDKYVVSPSYNDNISIIDSTLSGGSKVLEVKRTGQYDHMGVNYAKSDLSTFAQTSIGFRFWAASNTATGSKTNNLTVAFRFTDADGNHTYASTDGVWGANQLGNLSDEGAYYEVNWDTTKIDPGASFNKPGHNIIIPASNGNKDTTRVFDKSKLSTLTAISIVFEGAGTVGSIYYVDDLEFIYDTEAPTTKPTEVDGPTTDLVSTNEGASIRLNEVNGMRFYATANGDISNAEEIGIIIAPKDIVGDYFTMEDDHIKVVYDHKTYDLWEDNQFVGSIANIADKNLARDFIARAYVVIDGVTYYAETTTVRNIAGIADEFITDPKGNYDSLEADVKAKVDTWAKAND